MHVSTQQNCIFIFKKSTKTTFGSSVLLVRRKVQKIIFYFYQSATSVQTLPTYSNMVILKTGNTLFYTAQVSFKLSSVGFFFFFFSQHNIFHMFHKEQQTLIRPT